MSLHPEALQLLRYPVELAAAQQLANHMRTPASHHVTNDSI
jgi:hypothetical protein